MTYGHVTHEPVAWGADPWPPLPAHMLCGRPGASTGSGAVVLAHELAQVRARSAATCPAALQDRVPRPRGVHLVRVGKQGGGTIHHHPGPPPSTSSYQRRGQPPMPRGEGPALLAPSSLSLWEPSETRRPLQPETGTPTWIPEDPGPPPLLPRGTPPRQELAAAPRWLTGEGQARGFQTGEGAWLPALSQAPCSPWAQARAGTHPGGAPSRLVEVAPPPFPHSVEFRALILCLL